MKNVIVEIIKQLLFMTIELLINKLKQKRDNNDKEIK